MLFYFKPRTFVVKHLQSMKHIFLKNFKMKFFPEFEDKLKKTINNNNVNNYNFLITFHSFLY